MKKQIIIPLLLSALMLCGCTTKETEHNIKIAVLGDKESFYKNFEDGINDAVFDLNEKYPDSSFEVEYFDDNNDYNLGMKYIDQIVKDPEITAVIGSIDMDISRTASKLCGEAEKLFVTPYYLDNDAFTTKRYNTLFSTSFSADAVGTALFKAAYESGAKRWAVCCSDNKFEMDEMRAFASANTNNAEEIEIVDCIGFEEMLSNFESVYKRWELLGVNGVAMFANDKRGFELVKMLKARKPDIILGGDTAFDDRESLDNDPQLKADMAGLRMIDEFYIGDDKQNANILEIRQKFENKYQDHMDLWYLQGYDSINMIGEAAIKAKSDDGSQIAKVLHEDGYDAAAAHISFEESGISKSNVDYYAVFGTDGDTEVRYFKEGL